MRVLTALEVDLLEDACIVLTQEELETDVEPMDTTPRSASRFGGTEPRGSTQPVRQPETLSTLRTLRPYPYLGCGAKVS